MMNLDEAILEKWCKVNEFPNYSISNCGRVRNDILIILTELKMITV